MKRKSALVYTKEISKYLCKLPYFLPVYGIKSSKDLPKAQARANQFVEDQQSAMHTSLRASQQPMLSREKSKVNKFGTSDVATYLYDGMN